MAEVDASLVDPEREGIGSPRSITHLAQEALTSAVTQTGQLALALGSKSQLLERSRPGVSRTRTLVLNRPSVLHALSLEMIRGLEARLPILEESDASLVVLTSTPAARPAFCSGGDVRTVLQMQLDLAMPEDVFRHEFHFDSFVKRMRTPVLALMDGIVMGGGAGLAMPARFRVATERTVFAMPECKIGLICDVGASYFLSRLKPEGLGMYLALTGSTLIGAQAAAVGLATHFVHSSDIELLRERLETADIQDDHSITEVLEKFDQRDVSAPPIVGLEVIRDCFTASSVESIISLLQQTMSNGSGQAAKFASKTLATLKKRCPTSVKLVFEAQRRGADISLDECLQMEFRLISRCIRRDDFHSGVTSVLINKDGNPRWNPARLEDVTPDVVATFFEPLQNDLQIPELELPFTGSHKKEEANRRSRL